MNNRRIKSQKAITLVALIITIIVLLILAMVSIRLVMNGGIINKSQKGVDKYSSEEIKEQIKLVYAEYQMSHFSNDQQQTAQDYIQTSLRSTLKNNSITVSETNGNFTIDVSDNETYLFNSSNGSVELQTEPKITLSETNISYDDFVSFGKYYGIQLTVNVAEEYSNTEILWSMNTPDNTNLFFDNTNNLMARIEVHDQINYGDITITARIAGTDYVATCILDTSSGGHGPV